MVEEVRSPNIALKLTISSDVEEEFLVAEIESDRGVALLVTRDHRGRFYVQWPLFNATNGMARKVPLEELMSALEEAKLRIG